MSIHLFTSHYTPTFSANPGPISLQRSLVGEKCGSQEETEEIDDFSKEGVFINLNRDGFEECRGGRVIKKTVRTKLFNISFVGSIAD